MFAREDLARDARRQRARPAAELEDGRQPALGAGVGGDVVEVSLEGGHDEGLAEDSLLVAVEETAL